MTTVDTGGMRMLVHGECIGATHTVHVQQQRLKVSPGEQLSGKTQERGQRWQGSVE